ncbi:MAG: aspartate dehydrogenase domain-containing protein [Enterocloster sp.]
MNKKKLAILGNGHLAGIIVDAYINGLLPEYELTGVMGRTEEKTEALAEKGGCRACRTIEELLEAKPDYVAEAASVKAVKDHALTILSSGVSMIVLSIGAFADEEFYKAVGECAAAHGTRVHIASGAVGGFDVLRTVSLMGEAKVKFRTKKGPKSLAGTPVFKEHLLTDEKESRVFSGTAKGAIALLPTKVNVAVAASLATVGPDKTKMRIISVPEMTGDDHKITAKIDGVKAVIDIYSGTSDIAGWSIVAVLKNLVSPIVF